MENSWLPRALELSRARGFLSPQPIEGQIQHAEGFLAAWSAFRDTPPQAFLDLGSGGGLPGLVLMQAWADARGVLLDAMTKRVTFLDEVLAWEGAPEHGSAVLSRAEEASRRPELTEAFDLVTSRSFGPPAATAECATRFLKVGGLLIVSEPPEDDSASRWPLEGLRKVALRDLGRHRFGPAFEILEKTGPTPPLYPRPSGSTKKSPLF